MKRDSSLDPHRAGATEPGTDRAAEPTEHEGPLPSPTAASPDTVEALEHEDGVLLRQVVGLTSSMDVRLLQLSELFQGRLAYDKAKEEAFDRLYSELEQLKSNATFEQLRPLYLDIILLFDRIENICQSPQLIGQQDQNTLSLFKSLSDELLELLYRREIEVIQSSSPSSPAFDPSNQRAIGIEPTSVEGETGRVAKIVRRGFRYRNRLIRAEEVIVKKFAAAVSS
jgi:molecular chaperone GrpE (heat shock protein)